MAPQSRGKKEKAARSFKVVKNSKRTQTTKQYRFQSFSDRIAKLNIDPIRRTDARIETLENGDAISSHFRNALEDWRDKNLTDHFSNFLREVEPLTESLPQLLHHADRVAQLLLQYIENGTSLSLEPLLDLLAQYAHDLGVRFESHFESSVRALTNVARANEDIEIIERSLNSLVWLFKYLSRLLVPDLRPTYALLAPLLGREKQKPFVARFAAEALTFVLRKAAPKYERDSEPLRTFIHHVLDDVDGDSGNELYQRAIMTLFFEGIKGVQNGLHSAGLSILHELLRSIHVREGTGENAVRCAIVRGVVTALIHHCTAETFKPLLEEILQHIEQHTSHNGTLQAVTSLLYIVTAVRKGTRVTDWNAIYHCIEPIVEIANTLSNDCSEALAQRDVLVTASVILHLSPLQNALANRRLIDRVSGAGTLAEHFVFFCVTFLALDPDRFTTMILPGLKKHAHSWCDASLMILYPKLLASGIVSDCGAAQFDIGSAWNISIEKDFKKLFEKSPDETKGEELLHKCNGELSLPLHPTTLHTLTEQFEQHSDLVSGPNTALKDFVWGNLFKTLAASSAKRLALLQKACAQTAECTGLVPFWQSIESLLSHMANSEDPIESTAARNDIEMIIPSIEVMLSLPSHDLRFAGLRILQHIYKLTDRNVPEIINTALSIEQSSFDAQSARSVSMHVRRLAASYGDDLSDAWLFRTMPTYLLGLLHVHLSSVWTDVAEAMKVICQHSEAHDVVMELAVRWLIGSEKDFDELSVDYGEDDHDIEKKFYTAFECSNASHLDQVAEKRWQRMSNLQLELTRLFDKTNRRVPLVSKQCREKILGILNAIPAVAEKRSRAIVPLFLEWATNADSAEESDVSDATLTECSKQRWNRKDQKAMVTLFSLMGNPKVLYRSHDVHEALLGLLANGDSQLQNPALKALFTWSSSVLERHKEDLFNLLDDDRFRDTLTKIQIVGDDIEDPSIREEERDVLMPVLLRILYGRTIAKDGANSRGGGLEARKKAVFTAVKRFGDRELEKFVAISLGPLQGVTPLTSEDLLSVRKRQGLLNTLKTMISVLRQDAEGLVSQLANPVLYCLFRGHASSEHAAVELDTRIDSLVKDVRQLSLQTLTLLYELFPTHQWQEYLQPLYEMVISPKLSNLPIESAHSISGLLRLFSSWARSPQTAAFLFADNDDVLPKLAACLQVESAKDEVKIFIIGSIFMPLLQVSSGSTAIVGNIRRHGSSLLAGTEHVLRRWPSKELLDLGVGFVSQIGPLIPVGECLGLIEVSTFLLQQPSGRVSPRIKNGILKALQVLLKNLPTADTDTNSLGEPLIQIGGAFAITFTTGSTTEASERKAHSLAKDIYSTITSLFAFFDDRESRTVLSEVLGALTTPSQALSEVAAICKDLNAFDDSRLDEPAWDIRGDAWAKAISLASTYTLTQLTPMVWIALFNTRDQEDILRSNATMFLKRFIGAVKDTNEGESAELLAFVEQSVLQAIQRSMRSNSEEVRSSFLDVLAHAVRELSNWNAINDMRGLLVGSDEEEASFFNNVLHIQQHRRMRALRRLVKEASTGALSSGSIARIILPLLEHFVFDLKQPNDEGEPKGANAGQLAAESIVTIGALAEWLEWSQYRALLRRYGGYINERPEQEKLVMRLLGVMVDALSHSSIPMDPPTNGELGVIHGRLASSKPRPEKLAEELSKQILPQLTKYLHNKDEATVSRRAPVAVTVIKLLRLLPDADFAAQLPPVLMDLAHVLRSKADESRNLTRRTLAEIATTIGPSYFGFILRELRRALQRGYQLHVLSFTVHTLLVQVSDVFKPGDLDYCVNDLVAIVMDDIFGVTGQDKDAEEYVSKMKEVKSSKSYDSMELVASLTTLSHLTDLVRPIQLLLQEKLDDRLVKKVEELLRRVRRGLVRNEAVAQHGILIFCHEIWSETYKIAEPKSSQPRVDYKTKRYLVNMKAAHKAANRGLTSLHTSQLVCFAIDLMRDIIPKNEDLQKPSKLNGFMNMIGDAVVSGSKEVRVSVFKLIASLLRVVKAPFPRLNQDAAIYAREAMRVVRDAHSTKTDVAQAALRMVSEVLQKRQNTEIRETDTALLLKALKNDLDDAERQATAFNFLRAVIARRIVVPEAYDLMDDVARIMVTNHSKESRKLARDAYFAFMMDYPQAKGRLDKQVAYLVKNLNYQHLEGRQSVMEVLHLILTKVGNDLIGTVQDLVFLPLVMSMINDDEEKCRAFAGILIKDLFERADTARTKSWLKLMQGWVTQPQNVALRQAGFQCWELYLEVVPNAAEKTKEFVDALQGVLSDHENESDSITHDLVYFALRSFGAWARLAKDSAFTTGLSDLWAQVREVQFYPGAWIRLVASQLVGAYLAHFAKHSSDISIMPLISARGLEMGQQELVQVARACLIALQISDVHTELIDQAVKNLSFVMQCLATNGMSWSHGMSWSQGIRIVPPASSLLTNGDGGTGDEWGGVSDTEVSDEDDRSESNDQNAFDHVMVQLTGIMRRETSASGSKAALALYPKTAAMKLLAALLSSNTLSLDHLTRLTPVMLRTLNGLADSATTHATSINVEYTTAQTNLIESARELMGKLQDALGNEQYHAAMITVKKEAKERREGRRRKRKLDIVNEPDRMDALKRKKRDAAKTRRKAKSQEMRGRRRGW